ncbi:MAG: carboxypeptidase-like regulatory domain-containing protein [Bacteroidales bacterium]|nr:carboxypeptidase-like regulatory domain-containing protein [Bacteroidales bacterium]
MKSVTSILILLLLLITDTVFSQTVTQTVKGKVFDNETQTPLIGATVVVLGTSTSALILIILH